MVYIPREVYTHHGVPPPIPRGVLYLSWSSSHTQGCTIPTMVPLIHPGRYTHPMYPSGRHTHPMYTPQGGIHTRYTSVFGRIWRDIHLLYLRLWENMERIYTYYTSVFGRIREVYTRYTSVFGELGRELCPLYLRLWEN